MLGPQPRCLLGPLASGMSGFLAGYVLYRLLGWALVALGTLGNQGDRTSFLLQTYVVLGNLEWVKGLLARCVLDSLMGLW